MKSHLKSYLKTTYAKYKILKNGFWFVDIPRTSSSSIKSELGKKYGIAYGKSNIFEQKYSNQQIFPDHLPAREMRKILGAERWENLFTFTLVRNPWDRILSLYNYRLKVDSIPKSMSFPDYVGELRRMDDKYFKYWGYRYSSYEYTIAEDGQKLISFIGKFENRQQDLAFIANKIKCNALGNVFVQKASPEGEHYSTCYNHKTRSIIEQVFRKDIEYFEYEFEAP
jgi:hypothetical protein